MNIEKTIKSLEKNRFKVTYFEQAEDAAKYLDEAIDGKVVGFGDSITMKSMKLYERLSAHNEVHDPNQSTDNDEFLEIAMKCLDTEIYLTSVNAMSETGEMVNIDGTGNRVSQTLYGPEKIYFIVGSNKIEPDLARAMERAKNVAAPKNARRLGSATPCAAKGDRCYDCSSPGRICRSTVIIERPSNGMEAEIVFVDEALGY